MAPLKPRTMSSEKIVRPPLHVMRQDMIKSYQVLFLVIPISNSNLGRTPSGMPFSQSGEIFNQRLESMPVLSILQENLRFLNFLKEPCEKLAEATPPEIPAILPELLNYVRSSGSSC